MRREPAEQRKPHRRLRTLLSTDTGLTVLLVSLAAVLFVIYPFVPSTGTGRLVASLAVSVMLLSGISSLADRRRLLVLVIALGTAALLTRWLGHFVDRPALLISNRVCTILFLGCTLGGVLAKVLRKGRITSHRIQGAVAVYLMLGLLWAFLYSLIELLEPGSFKMPASPAVEPPAAGESQMSRFVYFSFVTLTTLGYGDITPLSSPARTLAIVEALAGQLFIGILIARLISLQIAHSRGEDP